MTARTSRLPLRRHGFALVGAAAGLIGLGQSWATLTLSTGQTISLAGANQAPTAVSLLLVAAAAHGLSFLVYTTAHRLTAVIQGLASAGAMWAVVVSLDETVRRASPEITALTGLSGEATVSDLVQSVVLHPIPVGFSLLGAGCFLVASAIGVLYQRVRPDHRSRFERGGSDDAGEPWDQLSEGTDPTDR